MLSTMMDKSFELTNATDSTDATAASFQDGASLCTEEERKDLPFSDLGLVGRSKEVQILQAVVDRVIPAQRAASLVNAAPAPDDPAHNTMALISGHSGTGKSSLAMHFQQQCFERHAFFVTGKFDLKQTEEPYSGIKAALADLCQQMLTLQRPEQHSAMSVYSSSTSSDGGDEDPRRLSNLQNLLKDGLSAIEIQALSNVIPDITKVLKEAEEQQQQPHPNNTATKLLRSTSHTSIKSSDTGVNSQQHIIDTNRMGYREQSERLKFALQRFLQIVCQFCPVVIVIDDLQWGDKASMDLLRSWIFMDAGTSTAAGMAVYSLLIMGCFRSDTSERNPILQDTIEELESAQKARTVDLVEINLGDMDISQVHELVCGLLLPPKRNNQENNELIPISIGSSESLASARIVRKRTGGNIFFIKQFLQQLYVDGLIYHDPTQNCWASKDEEEIVAQSTATTNIADLIKDQIQKLQAARQILPVAACLGATFSESTLKVVIRSLSIHSDHAAFLRDTFDMPRNIKESWVSGVLKSCEREGLIESHQKRSDGLLAAQQKKLRKGPTRRSSKDHSRNHEKQQPNPGLYSFVHDKVQEASFSLLQADRVTELQYRVGEALSVCLTPSDLEDNIFMVASLLNLRHDLVPMPTAAIVE